MFRIADRKTRRGGFTLIELMLVLGILVLLGTIAVVGYSQIKKGANIDATKAMVDQTRNQVDLYYTTMDKYPDTDQGLAALVTAPDDEAERAKWSKAGPFLKEGKIPVDPWGNALNYEYVGDAGMTSGGVQFHVWSNGPDGTPQTEDDIRSWKEDSGI